MASLKKLTLALLSSIIMASSSLAIASAVGTTTSTQTAACPTGTTPASIYAPTMHYLHPAEPDLADGPVSELHIQRQGNASTLEQVAIFSGIPARAKTCTLNWAQADLGGRHFAVDANGLLEVLQLSSLPLPSDSNALTAASVAPFVDAATAAGNVVLHPDTTGWDSPAYGVGTHIAGFVDCAEEIYLRVAVDGRMGRASDGHVYLGQDFQNGLFVTSTC
ncbi:Uu.00g038910.m01.CDS01 [Anthostomella pinea]|uniref:Uu.00g038910.m01.CDS01 n=1 Tax=Anthostomella pinea TaxID=933095 RepID=A0AAI8V4Y8_9PEZI|nr:Uu.00g038910.m01.CDS01 [Anthostomella pinea]